MTMRNLYRRTAATLTAAVLCGTLLAGCSDNSTTNSQSESVTFSDQWIKAADSGMTAAFGQLANTGDSDVRVVALTSPASGRVEIHEMATNEGGSMVMREKDGGLVIPAKSSHSLEPGGDHLMFMDITSPITAGQTVDITLEFEDDSQQQVQAQVRDFAGNEENYDPGTDGSVSEPMDMAPATGTHGG